MVLIPTALSSKHWPPRPRALRSSGTNSTASGRRKLQWQQGPELQLPPPTSEQVHVHYLGRRTAVSSEKRLACLCRLNSKLASPPPYGALTYGLAPTGRACDGGPHSLCGRVNGHTIKWPPCNAVHYSVPSSAQPPQQQLEAERAWPSGALRPYTHTHTLYT